MSTLSKGQMSAMVYAVEKGFELRDSCPWIADDFRNGKSISQISKNPRIKNIVNGTLGTIIGAVRFALRGYEGEVDISEIRGYSGLMESQEEYAQIVRKHNVQSSHEFGIERYLEGIGIADMTPKQRKKVGRDSGLERFKEGSGIHAPQTYKEQRAISRLGVLAQGKIPWPDEEMADCYEFSQQKRFKIGPQSQTNWVELVRLVNQKHHGGREIRTNRGAEKAARRWRKHLSKSTQ